MSVDLILNDAINSINSLHVSGIANKECAKKNDQRMELIV